MTAHFKSLAFYLFPFVGVSLLWIFDIQLLTTVTGNTGLAIWITGALSAYYAIIIFLNSSLRQASVLILIVSLFALVFLPVRQNIAVVDYVATDSEIYWIERSYTSGVLQVFVAKKEVFIKATKLYQDDEITHEAFLELNQDGLATLLYSRKSSDEQYHRHDLKPFMFLNPPTGIFTD